MSQTVILGTITRRPGSETLRVTTPPGDILVIDQSQVEREDASEAGGNLMRIVLKDDAKVLIEVTGQSLSGIDAMTDTITKWVDDGGTISKSRDDL